MVASRRTRSTPETYMSQPTSRALGWDKIYIGTVKNTVDKQKMGRLQVWIPELCVDILASEDDKATWINVSYASMFGGASNVQDNTNENTFEGTQCSYGWWGIPPDRNVQVGVFFANGDPKRGFWFCCLFDQSMTSMVPAIGNTNCETNRKVNRATPESPKPKFTPLDDALTEQGTQTDDLRGISLSSAQRTGDYGTDTDESSLKHKDRPAKVYGFLSPGGNHMVFDDGYTAANGEVENNLIRFRTRNGSQILIDNTTGFIYFITRNGKTWLEITDQYGGNVDIYSEGSISLHAKNGNINLKAGGEIIMEAGTNIHTTAGNHILTRANGDLNTKSEGETTFESGGNMSLRTGSTMFQTSASTYNVNAGGNILETAPKIHMNGPTAATADTADIPILPRRTPEHEPWDVHTFKSVARVEGDDYRGGSAQQAPASGDSPGDQPPPGPTVPFDGTLPGLICNMTEDETRNYLGGLRRRESQLTSVYGGIFATSSAHTPELLDRDGNIELSPGDPIVGEVNWAGYAGQYQFGTQALTGLGYMKPGSNSNVRQNDPNEWNTTVAPDGGIINSKASYLLNESAQTASAIGLANQNCQSAKNAGIDMNSLSPGDKTGILYAAHLKGAGAANKLWKSNLKSIARDGNQTSNLSYFRSGKAAQGEDI